MHDRLYAFRRVKRGRLKASHSQQQSIKKGCFSWEAPLIPYSQQTEYKLGKQVTGDDHLLNLAGTFINFSDLGVTHEAFHRIVGGKADTTMQLN